jgi:prolipoprotein diacylglyceryltransferase
MIALIGQVLSLLLILLGRWFKMTDEKKQKAKEIMKEVSNAKDPSTITAMFDAINRL